MKSRQIAFILHLDIFCSIESKNRAGYITKQRTHIQSEEMYHIWHLNLCYYSPIILHQHFGNIIVIRIRHSASVRPYIKCLFKHFTV